MRDFYEDWNSSQSPELNPAEGTYLGAALGGHTFFLSKEGVSLQAPPRSSPPPPCYFLWLWEMAMAMLFLEASEA